MHSQVQANAWDSHIWHFSTGYFLTDDASVSQAACFAPLCSLECLWNLQCGASDVKADAKRVTAFRGTTFSSALLIRQQVLLGHLLQCHRLTPLTHQPFDVGRNSMIRIRGEGNQWWDVEASCDEYPEWEDDTVKL